MTTRALSALVAAALALVSRGAMLAAQDVARDTARVTPVVVTATRSPIAAGHTPASVTVVTGEQLRSQGITTLTDALRQVPGLSVVQTGSYGGATSLFIRGGESKYAKILVDGVPVNDAGGAYDLSTLSTDNLDRIEIVRGPVSVLYGSDAMAGVVQLFTRRGTGEPHGELSARGGGFGSRDLDGGIRGSREHLTYSLGAAQHRTDGFQPFNSGFRQGVGSALLGAVLGGADATLSARFADRELHFPTNGSGQVVDSNAVRRDDRVDVGLDAGYRLGSRAALRMTLASHDVHGITDDQPDNSADKGYAYTTAERSRRRSGDLRLDLDLPSSARLTLGTQVERKWQESITHSNFGDDAPAPARRRSTGGYAQLLLEPVSGSTVALGGRFEHNEQFGDFWTYRAAASAQIAPATRLRASVGTAFREPTFLETDGSGFVIGNHDLDPEHALSVDAGVEQTLGRWGSIAATYFANSFRDMIDYQYSDSKPNYFNVARTRAAGAELEARVNLPHGLRADAALTHLETRVIDPGTSSAVTATFAPGARLLRRPMHTLDAGVGYRGARHGLELRARRVGSREDVYYAPDFSANRVTLSPYTRADLSADAQLVPLGARRGVTATLRIENLFDAAYTEAAGFNYDFARTDAASLSQTGYRGAGRRALVGLRVGL
ncbi:MAG TPA: TonB-dependent receptor [Gemmatimonadaceae bacterium]|nr:TonB-dependent receptor [Gemmatimonadaceae bacterium]